jgi:hypothetical protein
MEDAAPLCKKGHGVKIRRNDKNWAKGWRWTCLECEREAGRARRERDPEKVRLQTRELYERHPDRRRDYMLRHRYGITAAQYDSLLEDQGGVCAICARSNASGRRLHTDHDHATGKVRGLLCERCNRYLSVVENPDIHEAMLAYLTKHREASH